MFTCLFTEAFETAGREPVPTDSDPRYFYKHETYEDDVFCFESTLHKGHYLAVKNARPVLKPCDDPVHDPDVQFFICKAMCSA